MARIDQARAGRAPLTPLLVAAAGSADYASAFSVEAAIGDRSAEQWARAMFEQAPRSLRWSVLLGWRTVLRLRLGSFDSPDHVLGWRIIRNAPGRVDLTVESALLTARKVVLATDEAVTVATFVDYGSQLAKPIWAAVSVVHHRLEPMLLTRAANPSSR